MVINRLRMGYTLLSHGYVMNDVPDVAPHCKLCNNAILAIKHIMLECEQLKDARRACLEMCRRNRPIYMRDLLIKSPKFFEVDYILKSVFACNLIYISCRS